MNWINIKDRVPKPDQLVLVFANGVVQEALFTYEINVPEELAPIGAWTNDFCDDLFAVKPEHYWMPFPKPPDIQCR